MKEIPLSQGKVALVDDDDFLFLNSFNWYAKEGNGGWYAIRNERINTSSMRGCKVKTKNRKRKQIFMHNAIMHPSDDEMPHHKDDDGLNNQRYNLELCTIGENKQYAVDKRKEDDGDIPF